jgi:hypothetical protein
METKQVTIDVTNQTPTQRQETFAEHFNRGGLKKFNKKTNNHKTIYDFQYQN